MIPFFLAAAILATGQPAVSAVVLSTAIAGACAGPGIIATSASVHIAWTLTNPDPSLYSVKVYENGALLQTLAGDATSYDKPVSGAVENGSTASWFSNWTYRVDVVRNSDSVAVSSATSTAWVKKYGGC